MESKIITTSKILNEESYFILNKYKVELNIEIIFLDLLYDVEAENKENFVSKIIVENLNSNIFKDSEEPQKSNILSSIITNIQNKRYSIKLKTEIYNKNCFYQYFNVKYIFLDKSKKETINNYTIPLYYNQSNSIYSLYYCKGNMSFEIIIRRDTFFEDEWIREPIIDFAIKKDKLLEIKSAETFEKDAVHKRFLFVNIDSYRKFPNLNLGKYGIFRYDFTTSVSTNFTIYLDEDFDHIGFFMHKANNVIEKKINLASLSRLFNKCRLFERFINTIKDLYTIGKYTFYKNCKKSLIYSMSKKTLVFDVEEMNNFNLFFRQDIMKLTENDGINLVKNYSYYYLITKILENNENKKYFDYIVTMFITFINYLNKDKYDIIDKYKLIYSVAVLLAEYVKDDYIKNIENIKLEDIPKKNLIRIINFKKDKESIYSFTENNNNQIINNLKTDSYLFYILTQLNSSIGKNLIRSNYITSGKTTCSMLSMITLNNLKNEFLSIKQKYGIRIGFKTDYKAVTNIITKITCYNEINIFGKFLENLETKFDKNYTQRIKLSCVMKHERFCHTLVSINIFTGNLKGSPEEYLYFENKNKIELVIGGVQESGGAFEYLVVQNIKFWEFLNSGNQNVNYEDFFNINLWTDNTMKELYDLYLRLTGKDDDNGSGLLIPKLSAKMNIYDSQVKYKKGGKNQGEDNEGENNYSIIKICRNKYCDKFQEKIMKKNNYI